MAVDFSTTVGLLIRKARRVSELVTGRDQGAYVEMRSRGERLGTDYRGDVAEFHHRIQRPGAERTLKALRLLGAVGFEIFHVSDNGATLSLMHTSGSDLYSSVVETAGGR
jgi:hypothetical protein